MSAEAVTDFLDKIAAEPALRDAVRRAVGDREGQAAATAFAEVGAEHGFVFTAGEVSRVGQDLMARGDSELGDSELSDSELSDAELQAVAGGGLWPPMRNFLRNLVPW